MFRTDSVYLVCGTNYRVPTLLHGFEFLRLDLQVAKKTAPLHTVDTVGNYRIAKSV